MANYNFEKTVLDMHSFYYTLPCQVTNTGLTADSNGKKIIKAGTPVGGDTNALLNRDTAVLIATNDATTITNAFVIIVSSFYLYLQHTLICAV